MINYIGNKISPKVLNIVEDNVNKEMNNYIFNMFSKDILVKEDLNNIISLSKNNNGEIVAVDYKYNKAYEYLGNSMKKLASNIDNFKLNVKYYDTKNDIFFIPLGMISSNFLLENYGIKIPCKVILLNDVKMGLRTMITNYGINNLLIEVYLNINITNYYILPSYNKKIDNNYEIIINSKVIVGKIPDYYGGSIEENKTILSS